jgi:hypothetical protein
MSLPCDYAIPPPENGRIDPAKVNVRFSSTGADPVIFPQVGSAAECRAGETNWYYDNLSAPERVIMCPSTCELISTNFGQIEMVFGCATQVVVR